MPGYCEPCPVKSRATRGRPPGPPVRRVSRSSSSAARRRTAARSAVSVAGTAKRCRWPVLSRVLLQPTAPTGVTRWRWRASACATRLRRSACAVGAVRVNTAAPRPVGRAADPAVGRAAPPGADSSTAWALVPPMPKLLRPPTVVPAASRRGALSSRRPYLESFSAGFSLAANRLAGTTRWCRESATLMSPAIPAAPSVWPRLPLTEPSASGLPARSACRSPSALTSIMSPSTVPVPWPSVKATSDGSTPARR